MAVINTNLADGLWPGQSPLGRILTVLGKPATVVGVVPTGGYSSLQPADPVNFVFLGENPDSDTPGAMAFHLRYAGDFSPVASAVQRSIRALRGALRSQAPTPTQSV